VGADRDVDDQVLAVLAHAPVKLPVGVLGIGVDQLVGLLLAAERVIKELLILVDLLELLARPGGIVGAVEEALVVGGPRDPGELAPLEQIRAVLAGRNLADLPALPVGAGVGQRVGQVLAVVADRQRGDRGGAVLAQQVGIEQQLGLAVERVGPVVDRLILQAVVPGEEVAAALLPWGRVALEIPQALESLLNG